MIPTAGSCSQGTGFACDPAGSSVSAGGMRWPSRLILLSTWCLKDSSGLVMFLALRELSFARGRFALMGSVVALIGVLMVLLSGLSVGLVNDGVSGLQKLPVSSFAFESGVDRGAAFTRSMVELDKAEVSGD